MTLAPPTIRCGRLETHPSGIGYQIHLPDGTKCYGQGGEGLTIEEAERVLDRIEQWQGMQKKQQVHADRFGASIDG